MVKSHLNELVLITVRVHLFPSRTQKLSSRVPTILGGRLPGKIGNANIEPRLKSRGFFPPKTVHRTVFSRRYNTLAYPGSQVMLTQSLDRKVGAFFCLKQSTGLFFHGGTIRWPTREDWECQHKASTAKSGLFLPETVHRTDSCQYTIIISFPSVHTL